jgi:hypothetical protein
MNKFKNAPNQVTVWSNDRAQLSIVCFLLMLVMSCHHVDGRHMFNPTIQMSRFEKDASAYFIK